MRLPIDEVVHLHQIDHGHAQATERSLELRDPFVSLYSLRVLATDRRADGVEVERVLFGERREVWDERGGREHLVLRAVEEVHLRPRLGEPRVRERVLVVQLNRTLERVGRLVVRALAHRVHALIVERDRVGRRLVDRGATEVEGRPDDEEQRSDHAHERERRKRRSSKPLGHRDERARTNQVFGGR